MPECRVQIEKNLRGVFFTEEKRKKGKKEKGELTHLHSTPLTQQGASNKQCRIFFCCISAATVINSCCVYRCVLRRGDVCN